MENLKYITLREKPQLMEKSASWFNSKWGVPKEAYLECMQAYLSGETEYGWYLCLDGEKIVAGMGVIENVASVKVMENAGFEKEFQGISSYQGVDREICRYVYRIAG